MCTSYLCSSHPSDSTIVAPGNPYHGDERCVDRDWLVSSKFVSSSRHRLPQERTLMTWCVAVSIFLLQTLLIPEILMEVLWSDQTFFFYLTQPEARPWIILFYNYMSLHIYSPFKYNLRMLLGLKELCPNRMWRSIFLQSM